MKRRSVFIINAEDFLEAVIDTRFDVRIVGVNQDNAQAVWEKLHSLYGDIPFNRQGIIYIQGDNDLLYKLRYSDGDLLQVMKRLTAENGCPWDRAQTHESIRLNAVEEAYELCEAIDNKDLENMKEEVGDLLLQAVFHANIAERTGEFSRIDVIDALVRKLVQRHTHIFGNKSAANPEEALGQWELVKSEEKQAKTLEQQLDRIPDSFPALLRTQKSVKKMIKFGLINDCEEASVMQLMSVACGCIKAGIDVEVELSRILSKLMSDFRAGRIKTISELSYEDN